MAGLFSTLDNEVLALIAQHAASGPDGTVSAASYRAAAVGWSTASSLLRDAFLDVKTPFDGRKSVQVITTTRLSFLLAFSGGKHFIEDTTADDALVTQSVDDPWGVLFLRDIEIPGKPLTAYWTEPPGNAGAQHARSTLPSVVLAHELDVSEMIRRFCGQDANDRIWRSAEALANKHSQISATQLLERECANNIVHLPVVDMPDSNCPRVAAATHFEWFGEKRRRVLSGRVAVFPSNEEDDEEAAIFDAESTVSWNYQLYDLEI